MLDGLYGFASPWATATKMQITKNRLLGFAANIIYPAYCAMTPMKGSGKEQGVVVSLTTFPARIEKVYLTLQSILRQERRAERVLLWLAEEDFPNENALPEKLLSLKQHGLEIRFCENLYSFKKIFYTAQEFPNSIIVTADDDTLYPESWLGGLLDTYAQYPDCVCCYRAHRIVFKNHEIAPYREWIGLSPKEKGPSKALLPVGVGGVLYPPKYFEGVCFDSDVIRKLCPTADDLWLKVLGAVKGIRTVKVRENTIEWFTVRDSQKVSLMSVNTREKMENDIAMRNLMEYYRVDQSMMDDSEA